MKDMDKKRSNMNKKYKIIALFGKSGAGKDTIQKCLVQFTNTHGIISCTTRPPREGEVDGEDYYFLSIENFTKKVLSGEMLEATEFRDWFYGTSMSALEKDMINIGVFNIEGIEALLNDPRLDVIPVLVYAEEKTRLIRCLNREENPDCEEICRRYFADEEDFKDIPFFYRIWINDKDLTKEDSDSFYKRWQSLESCFREN